MSVAVVKPLDVRIATALFVKSFSRNVFVYGD
jgi:hypothetical protein